MADREATIDRLITRIVEARGADEVLPLAERLTTAARESLASETKLAFVSFEELKLSAPPEPDWVLRGYLARGAVTLLAGKPKTGKSTLACALVEAIDADVPAFLGQRVAGGPVVYVSEEGVGTLAPKLPKSSRSTALTRDAAFPKPRWSDLIAAAVEEAKRIGAVVLVIDALSFWAGFGEGQEKDAGSAQSAMDALGEATKTGMAVLVVHHQRKAGGEDGDAVRGSGAIFGAVDALVEVERAGDETPGHRRLVAVTRWPGVTPVLVIDRDGSDGTWRVVGEAGSRGDAASLGYRDRLLQAMPPEAPGATEGELTSLLGVDQRKVSRPLRDLLGEGLAVRSGRGRRGDPYRYALSPPQCSPEDEGETAFTFSPSPIGGEIGREVSALPPGRKGQNRPSTIPPESTRVDSRTNGHRDRTDSEQLAALGISLYDDAEGTP